MSSERSIKNNRTLVFNQHLLIKLSPVQRDGRVSTSQAGLRGVLAPAPTPKAVALHVLQEAAHELVAIASCAICSKRDACGGR